MNRICIGIHTYEQPDGLLATLDAVRKNTPSRADVVLLADGPDPQTRRTLQTLDKLRVLHFDQPRGAPACFNRLASSSDADLVIFLESGARPAPNWLDRIAAALHADPTNGLAGPSTNMAWNEQGAFPNAGCTEAEITAAADECARRFGTAYRTLEPLYSLADFCYAVRREVIETIGAADERYGLGPCWEMDYNVRAARSGWRGVWACGAFVWRAPFTARRRREDQRRFEPNKRIYQDKFCGRHLRNGDAAYRAHCRGDMCPNFAPTALIQVERSFVPTPETQCRETSPASLPLISCIMPTKNRRPFVPLSIDCFIRQDYPNKELIVVDDGEDRIADLTENLPGVRYVSLPSSQTIGAKRNLACSQARGEIIVHWDDDDWYAPDRLRYQSDPIRAGEADLTGLANAFVLVLPNGQFWTTEPDLHRIMFYGDVHGGTLMYRRKLFDGGITYPNVSLAEDAWLIHSALRAGYRLRRLENAGRFVYVRHGGNAWKEFAPGQFLKPAGWRRASAPSNFPSATLSKYQTASQVPAEGNCR